jgi:putative endonuclease
VPREHLGRTRSAALPKRRGLSGQTHLPGEIDIADNRGTIVFVDVKTKTDCTFSDPVESVTKQKQRRLVSMADQYAAFHHLDNTPCRFDVLTVDPSVAPSKITHYKDAFRPGW